MSKNRNNSISWKSLIRVISALLMLITLMAIAGFVVRIGVLATFKLMLKANISMHYISTLAVCVLVLLVIVIWRGWLNRPLNILIVRPVISLLTVIAPLEHFDEVFRKKSNE